MFLYEPIKKEYLLLKDVKVQRVLQRGSVEEQRVLEARRQKRKAELGGQLAALDAFLGTGLQMCRCAI